MADTGNGMRGRIKTIFGVLAVVAVLAIGLGVGSTVVAGDPHVYYTRVDNEKVADAPVDSDMPYVYTLDAYDAQGSKQTLTFKTSRILRDDALLRVETLPLRGVISWSEAFEEDLPDAVRGLL